MKKFRGAFDAVLDVAKGRLVLPASIRKFLPENFDKQFIVNSGQEACITVYMQETWAPIADRIDEMPDLDPQVRKYKRLVNSGIEVEMDESFRMILPKHLIAYAQITKEVKVAGQGKYFEIWDKDTYENMLNADRGGDNYSETSLSIFNKYGDPFKEPTDAK